jgi:hypothetical protein
MDSSLSSDPLVRVSIQPGGDDGCKIVRYESATSDLVDVEEVLNDHEQVLRDIGKLEHHEFLLEQKRLAAIGGGGSVPTADGASTAGAMAQMLLTRESGKIKIIKDLLLAPTSGTPCMLGIPAIIRSAVEDSVRIAAKRQQLQDASALLRRHSQVFDKRARATMVTLRDLKHTLRPLWLTLPIHHQIKVCVGSDTFGGDIPCNARYLPAPLPAILPPPYPSLPHGVG